MTLATASVSARLTPAAALAAALAATLAAALATARHRRLRRFVAECVVADLAYYPVKALGPVRTDRVRAVRRGFLHDRRFMVVDATGSFITQRQYPRMSLVRVAVETPGDWDVPELAPRVTDAHALVLSAPDMPDLRVSGWTSGAPCTVRVWEATVEGALDQGDEAGAWLSRFLGLDGLRLAYQPTDGADRFTKRNPEHQVSFADAYPILVTSTSSLADLNRRLRTGGGEVLPMGRFRPNLVVSGLYPWLEDTVGLVLEWRDAAGRLGRLYVNKPCDRCKVTTVVPELGAYSPSGEPLRTLATFRRISGGAEVYFGANLLVLREAELRVGDRLAVRWTDPDEYEELLRRSTAPANEA